MGGRARLFPIECPPMQSLASRNLGAVEAKIVVGRAAISMQASDRIG